MIKRFLIAALLPGLSLGIDAARADSHLRFPLAATYREACGGCHVAYPPQFLQAPSWQALLDGLDSHFGQDARLAARRVGPIRDYLVANAGRSREPDPPAAGGGANLRITEALWFKREHLEDGERLTPYIWQSPRVGSPANCSACHRRAARGDYRRRGVRVPPPY